MDVRRRSGTISAKMGLFVAGAFHEMSRPIANSVEPCRYHREASRGMR
jgi:hypothetical protein